MPVKGSIVTYEDIGKFFSVIPMFECERTKLFMDGDHWQANHGWIGWRPEAQSRTAIYDWHVIETGFTSKNVIKGMVWRLRGAVLGKEPDWEIVSKQSRQTQPNVPVPASSSTPAPNLGPNPLGETQQTLTPEEKKWVDIDGLMTTWWTEKRVHKVMKDFVSNYASYGKASLQIYIPKGYVKPDAQGRVTLNINSQDLAEVLSKIYVVAPSFGGIIDVHDYDFGEDFVCLQVKKYNNTEPTIYEVHYVDESNQTHVRQVSEANQPAREVVVDLGGNLLTYVVGEFERSLISVPVKQQQKQVNHAKTMEGYALANINFPETTFINAALETEKGKGPDGKTVETVKPLWRGVGRFLNLVGITTIAGDGSEVLTTPQVIYKQPVDPEKFAKVAENNTRDMHQEAGMLYILLSSSPYPSGNARLESMTDYLILLVDYKTLVDTAGVWLLTTVLRLAFNFTGQTELNDLFSVIFSTELTIGRITPQDKAIMLQEVSAQLRSRRNYMITCQVSDDPDMELNVIASEPPPVQTAALNLGGNASVNPNPQSNDTGQGH